MVTAGSAWPLRVHSAPVGLDVSACSHLLWQVCLSLSWCFPPSLFQMIGDQSIQLPIWEWWASAFNASTVGTPPDSPKELGKVTHTFLRTGRGCLLIVFFASPSPINCLRKLGISFQENMRFDLILVRSCLRSFDLIVVCTSTVCSSCVWLSGDLLKSWQWWLQSLALFWSTSYTLTVHGLKMTCRPTLTAEQSVIIFTLNLGALGWSWLFWSLQALLPFQVLEGIWIYVGVSSQLLTGTRKEGCVWFWNKLCSFLLSIYLTN